MKASSLTGALVVRKGTALPSSPTPHVRAARPAIAPTIVSAPPTVNAVAATDTAPATTTFGVGQRKAMATAPVQLLRDTHKSSRAADEIPMPVAGSVCTSKAGGCGNPPGGGAGRGGGRVRMTLRMDARDHLRLKLAAAHSGKNMTRLIDEAIDSYLRKMGPMVNRGRCACLMGDGDDAA